jgi:transposase
MRTTARSDPKCEALREHATLNSHPEQVTDALFQTQPFFDPRDLVQVKYEMLRRVTVDGQPVGATAAAFGFSRVTLYQLRKRFEAEGLAGLLPQRKGPRRAHKLSDETLTFVLQTLEAEPKLRTAVPAASRPAIVRSAAECRNQYETLRRQALESSGLSSRKGLELAFIERQGLTAWMERGPDSQAADAVSADTQAREPEQAVPLRRNLILALADLVVGDRQEEQNGRST